MICITRSLHCLILHIILISFIGKKKSKSRDSVSRWAVKEAQPLRFKHAAVAADHYNCSLIGKDILKKGGNAVDSIIATHHCVEVCNLHSTGLGGGGFMMVYMKGKTPKDGKFVKRDSLIK